MWDSMIEMMELVMQHIVEIAILCFEFIGVIVIIISGAKGFWNYVRREPEMKITLAQGLAVGLEFKLCSEILKTVIVREWKEILTVAGIIGLRAALTFLIHWEIKEGVREEHGKKKKTVLERNADDHQLQYRRIFELYLRPFLEQESRLTKELAADEAIAVYDDPVVRSMDGYEAAGRIRPV